MLTTDRQANVRQQLNSAPGITTGTNSWAGNASCPDDCHYCSGPETD